ncbi:MAG TPA: WD40 repeat domain-containing serine/threonine-protein kinase [Phycisphaerae bacterium]|nr:WD40 repeat domain-containing serine/threonine-protein kinase [Phycisphaerae bacterium]
MSTTDPRQQSHRLWIQQARIQSDEADRYVARAGLSAESISATPVRNDHFPGYRLEREIHRGGQGTVYRAVQESTGRRVALKLLHNHVLGGPLERARFERETRVLAALQHPNIVTIHDGGSHDGQFFLVMDYIAGQTLDVYVASEPRSIRELLELLVQICDAVNAAHIGGIIHRDMKPANVRVDSSGRAIVLDFGLAKFTSAQHSAALEADGLQSAGADGASAPHGMTLTGQFIGSLPWAAPEQAEGSPDRIDTRTDVYALGVLLYQMLTGKFPYPVAGSVRSVLDNILKTEPIRPRSICRKVDDELETIVLKCLSKERERRYQTAGELAGDLSRYLKGEPIEAKRDSALYILRKTVRRYRAPLAVLASFVLLLLGFSIAASVLWVRARDAALAATKSEETAAFRLRDALVAEARAIRRSGRIGQRFAALKALATSASIGPALEARNESIAAMALPDLRPVRQLKQAGMAALDAKFERCAVLDTDNSSTVVRVADDTVLMRIPPPTTGVKEMHATRLVGDYFVRIFDPPSGNRRLEVWTVRDRRLHLELSDVPFKARFDISRDGQRLVIGRLDKAIHIYDLASAREVQRVPLDRDPSYVSFDPGCRRLALYHGNFTKARLLDLETGQSVPVFESTQIDWSVAWHPNGKLMAGATGYRIELWDVEANRSRGILAGHESIVVHLRFSNDGNLLLSYSWDGETFLWDARTLRPLLRMQLIYPEFSADDRLIGATVASEERSQVQLLELDSAPECRRLVCSDDPASIVEAEAVFHPTSGLLFLTGGGKSLRVCDATRAAEIVRLDEVPVRSLAMDVRGELLLTAGLTGLFSRSIQSAEPGIVVGPPKCHINGTTMSSLDLSEDGGRAVALPGAGGEIVLLECVSGGSAASGENDERPDAEARRAAIHGEPGGFSIVRRWKCSAVGRTRLRISRDGRWAAWGGWETKGELWDLDRGVQIREFPGAHFAGLAFSPDGRHCVCSDRDGISSLEVGTWRLLRKIDGQFRNVCYSPDGRLLATCLDSTTVRLLDGETLEEVARLEPAESYTTMDIAFSPDGALLAQVTNRAGVVHVWNLRRIRGELAKMNLDWDQPPYPPANPRNVTPGDVSIHYNAAPPNS